MTQRGPVATEPQTEPQADPTPARAGARPTSGVRYALERTTVTPAEVLYEGFAHLPQEDVPMRVRVALPGGAVTAEVTGAPHDRAADFAKVLTALMRAATKAELAAGQQLPRKVVRWRG